MSQNIGKHQVKQVFGEKLYPLIERTHPDLAGKITGMLIELDDSEIELILKSKKKLDEMISECLKVLETHQKNLKEVSSDKDCSSKISLDEESTEDCVICMESLGDKNICVTKCGHKFCTSCLLRSAQKNRSCPLCRTVLVPKNNFYEEEYEEAYQSGRENGIEEITELANEHIDILREQIEELTVFKKKYIDLKKKLWSFKSEAFNNGYRYALKGDKENETNKLPCFNIDCDTEFPSLS